MPDRRTRSLCPPLRTVSCTVPRAACTVALTVVSPVARHMQCVAPCNIAVLTGSLAPHRIQLVVLRNTTLLVDSLVPHMQRVVHHPAFLADSLVPHQMDLPVLRTSRLLVDNPAACVPEDPSVVAAVAVAVCMLGAASVVPSALPEVRWERRCLNRKCRTLMPTFRMVVAVVAAVLAPTAAAALTSLARRESAGIVLFDALLPVQYDYNRECSLLLLREIRAV